MLRRVSILRSNYQLRSNHPQHKAILKLQEEYASVHNQRGKSGSIERSRRTVCVKSLPKSLRIIKQQENINIEIGLFNAAVELCVKANDIGTARTIIKMMEQNNVKPNSGTINNMLKLTVRTGNKDMMLMVWYERLLQTGSKPTENTYLSLIRGVLRENESLGGDIWNSMLKDDIIPTATLYSEYISNCQTYKHALLKFNEAKEAGFCDPRLFTTIIKKAAFHKLVDEAKTHFDDMLKTSIRPGVQQYSILISAYAQVGQVSKALEVFENMSQRGIRPSFITYTALLNACRFAIPPDVPVAEDIFKRAICEKESNKSPLVWTAMLRVYAEAGDEESFEKIAVKIRSQFPTIQNKVQWNLTRCREVKRENLQKIRNA